MLRKFSERLKTIFDRAETDNDVATELRRMHLAQCANGLAIILFIERHEHQRGQ